MGEVINFPEKTKPDWPLIEGVLREHLTESGIPTPVHSRVLNATKRFYTNIPKEAQIDVNMLLPESLTSSQRIQIKELIEEAMRLQREAIVEYLVTELVEERVEREVLICKELGLI